MGLGSALDGENKAPKSDANVINSCDIWIRLLVEESCWLYCVLGHTSANPRALFRQFK